MTNLGETIGKMSRDIDNFKSGVHDIGDIMSYILASIGVITIKETEVVIQERNYDTNNLVLIWGHSTRGVWGTNKWGTDATAFDSWSTVETLTEDATLTNTGKNEIRDWIAGDSATHVTHIGIGTGDIVVTTDDIELVSEVARGTTTNSKI